MTKPDSYFICGTPRTGSTLLCALLKSSIIAGVPESYFRAQDKEKWANKWDLAKDADDKSFIEAAIAAGKGNSDICAARIMWGTMDELVSRVKTAYGLDHALDIDTLSHVFGKSRFIYIKREDKVAQAVSLVRALQTDIWHITGDNTQNSAAGLNYDYEQILHYKKEAERHHEEWQKWFAENDIKAHEVIYETLQENPEEEAKKVLAFLGLELPADQKLTAPNKRMTDDTSAQWIKKFKDGA